MHNVIISRVVNGILVQVGCQSFVFNDIDKAMGYIAEYLKTPELANKRWAQDLKKFASFRDVGEDMPRTAMEAPQLRGYATAAPGGVGVGYTEPMEPASPSRGQFQRSVRDAD